MSSRRRSASLGSTKVGPPQGSLHRLEARSMTEPKRSPPKPKKKKPAARSKKDMPLAQTDAEGWIARNGPPKPAAKAARKPAARKPAAKPTKPAAKPAARRVPPPPPESSDDEAISSDDEPVSIVGKRGAASSDEDLPSPKPAARRRKPPPEDFTKDLAASDDSISEPEAPPRPPLAESSESDDGLDDTRRKVKADAAAYNFDSDDDNDVPPPRRQKASKATYEHSDSDDDGALAPKRPARRRSAAPESDTQDSALESRRPAWRRSAGDRPASSQDSARSATKKKKKKRSTTGNDAAIARLLACPAGATPDDDDDDDILYTKSPVAVAKPSNRRLRSESDEEEAAEVLPEKRSRGAPRERTPAQPSPKPRRGSQDGSVAKKAPRRKPARSQSSQDPDGSAAKKVKKPPRKKKRDAPTATQDLDIGDFLDSRSPRQTQDDSSDGERPDPPAWRDVPEAVAGVRTWRVRSAGLVWASTGDDYYGDGRRGGFKKRPAYALRRREVAHLNLPPALKNHAYVRVFDDAAFPPWDAPRLMPLSSLLDFRGDATAPRWDPPRVKAMKGKLPAAEFAHVFERGAAAALARALENDEDSDSEAEVRPPRPRPPQESQGDAHQDEVRDFLYERRPAQFPRLAYEALVDLCVDPYMYGARLAREAYEPASAEVRAAVRAAVVACDLDALVLDRARRTLDAVEDGSILEFIK